MIWEPGEKNPLPGWLVLVLVGLVASAWMIKTSAHALAVIRAEERIDAARAACAANEEWAALDAREAVLASAMARTVVGTRKHLEELEFNARQFEDACR